MEHRFYARFAYAAMRGTLGKFVLDSDAYVDGYVFLAVSSLTLAVFP